MINRRRKNAAKRSHKRGLDYYFVTCAAVAAMILLSLFSLVLKSAQPASGIEVRGVTVTVNRASEQPSQGFFERIALSLFNPVDILQSQVPTSKGLTDTAPVISLQPDGDDSDAQGEHPIDGEPLAISVNNRHSTRTDGPLVLIYHTHTTEAYEPTKENPYEESDFYRTQDHDKSVVRVGKELAHTLENEYGIRVIHDTTDHEPPLLTTAYDRSLSTIQRYVEQYPSLCVFIDVHRDAYYESIQLQTVGAADQEVARVMFVVGKGRADGGDPIYPGHSMPDFDANYAAAQALSKRLNLQIDGLSRGVLAKNKHYNQIFDGTGILLEMGNHKNTLEQVLRAVPHVAKAIHDELFTNGE
ncbi:MAG: stage II sporulation protein P [Christensenellales bacterium]